MKDIIIGLFAIGIGVLFCFRGYLAMRVVIPIWGAFAGFLLGAGIVDVAGDDGFLRTATAWIVGFVMAILFSALAYVYYEISVLIGMTGIGFVLGSTVTVAVGITWSWVIIAVGIIVAILLAAIAIVADIPMLILTVLTAAAGASTVVAGVMMLTNTLSTDDLGSSLTTEHLDDGPIWYVMYIALVISGIIAQVQATERMRSSLRSTWADDGGRQLGTR